jgi:hypothetical protein
MRPRQVNRRALAGIVTIFHGLWLSLNLFLGPGLPGAESTPQLAKNYWGDTNRFLSEQAGAILAATQDTLSRLPPAISEPKERRMAMLLLDAVLHDQEAAKRTPVQQFYRARLERAVREMEQTRVETGAVIWKLYNHAFVVRTATVTLGFDLIRGYAAKAPEFAAPDALMLRVVYQCDALFVSHSHSDHADAWVAAQCLEQAKLVVAPEGVWAGTPLHDRVRHLARTSQQIHSLPVQGNRRSLSVVIFPGHQGTDTTNNVTWVRTPEKLSFCHTGDQFNAEDFAWIDQMAASYPCDVLLPNCWTMDVLRLIRGAQPALVLTGHENELGHTIDHREPNWLTYERFAGSAAPFVVMTWGEFYHYRPAR